MSASLPDPMPVIVASDDEARIMRMVWGREFLEAWHAGDPERAEIALAMREEWE